MTLIDLSDVEHATDVGMRHAQRHPDFGDESIEPFGIVLDLWRQELQRDRLAELEIVRPVNLTHPAAAEQADHAVTAREHRAWQEAARAAHRARRRSHTGI